MITDSQRDECLQFLITTDESVAKARSYMIGLEKQEKTVLATELLFSDKKTLGLRAAESRTSRAHSNWLKEYSDAVFDYELLRNKRNTSSMIIELWRSEFSARKQGMII